ncbi:hypothetical protein [Streptosporangium subroseum]|nr:hypothetical protein OHB15_34940 [Streptosporangium subroseum]
MTNLAIAANALRKSYGQARALLDEHTVLRGRAQTGIRMSTATLP